MPSNAEQLKRVVEARDVLKDAKQGECTCSGFWCVCDERVKKAERELQSAIDALQVTAVDKDVLITNEDNEGERERNEK